MSHTLSIEIVYKIVFDNQKPAKAPKISTIVYNIKSVCVIFFATIIPNAMAGLNAPPDIAPPNKTPIASAAPMAK